MEIILFSPLPPPVGGMAIWTKTYLKFFGLNKNIKINLIDTSMNGNDVNYNGFFKEFKREINIFRKCLKYRKKRECIIHFNTPANKIGLLRDYYCAKILKNNDNNSLVCHFHCDLSEQKYNKISYYFLKKIIKISDKVLVLNNNSQKIVEELNYKSLIVNNFCDDLELDKYRINNLNNTIKDVCYIGRFNNEKGSKEFLEVSKNYKDINFHVYGPIECDVNINDYKNVEFTGTLNRNELFKRIKNNDLMLFLSKHEGSPLSIIETSYIGVPIITTNVGNVSEMLDESCVLNENSIDGVKVKLEKYFDLKTRNDSVEKNKKIIEEFTISKVASKLLNIYEEILKSK